MTFFYLVKGQTCQAHSSQYSEEHPFSPETWTKRGLQNAGVRCADLTETNSSTTHQLIKDKGTLCHWSGSPLRFFLHHLTMEAAFILWSAWFKELKSKGSLLLDLILVIKSRWNKNTFYFYLLMYFEVIIWVCSSIFCPHFKVLFCFLLLLKCQLICWYIL